MCTFNWENFLNQWSWELLESIGDRQADLPSEVIQSKWMGYPGATEEQIVCAETRLGTTLPPSYREFLKVTNGWRQTTPFIYRLWSTEEIEWFSVRHPIWIDTFLEQFLERFAKRKSANYSTNGWNDHRQESWVPDYDYLVYSQEQACENIRLGYLKTALEISDKGDSAIYLLNPQVSTGDGEWEAWFFCDWLPGADRYRSFQEMMQAEYRNFLELRET